MPFENILNFEVRAFFFNSATDYLPYYKNFSIAIDKGATTLDLLNRIKTQNPDFSFPNKNVILKVNDMVTSADTCVTKLAENFGENIQVDPAFTYRSNNGLILNDDDFMESFELLAPYASDADKEFYETLYATHYASETTNYNRQFIGDAILVLASKMIADGSEHKEAILTAISDEFNGIRCCEYENNVLEGQNHAQTITHLKGMVTLKDTATACDKMVLCKKDHKLNMENFEGQGIALYVGDKTSAELVSKTKAQVLSAGATFVSFEKSTKLAGQTLMDTHFELAHTKAGIMLLNALDSGADILVVAKNADLNILKKALVPAQRIMGRDIELTLISLNEFLDMCTVSA